MRFPLLGFSSISVSGVSQGGTEGWDFFYGVGLGQDESVYLGGQLFNLFLLVKVHSNGTVLWKWSVRRGRCCSVYPACLWSDDAACPVSDTVRLIRCTARHGVDPHAGGSSRLRGCRRLRSRRVVGDGVVGAEPEPHPELEHGGVLFICSSFGVVGVYARRRRHPISVARSDLIKMPSIRNGSAVPSSAHALRVSPDGNSRAVHRD